MDLIRRFYKKLDGEQRTLKWFLDHYLPKAFYATIQNQLKRRVSLADKTAKAMRKYLDD